MTKTLFLSSKAACYRSILEKIVWQKGSQCLCSQSIKNYKRLMENCLLIIVSSKSSVALLIFCQLMRDNVWVFKWKLSTSVLNSVIFLVSFILKLCYWVQAHLELLCPLVESTVLLLVKCMFLSWVILSILKFSLSDIKKKKTSSFLLISIYMIHPFFILLLLNYLYLYFKIGFI